MRTAIAYRNAALDAELDPVAKIRIYSAGSGRPANADTAITDQVLLAEITVDWDAASGGAKALADEYVDPSANATGTAAWARGVTSGDVAVADFSVGDGSGEISLNRLDIEAGGPVRITGGTVTYPVGA